MKLISMIFLSLFLTKGCSKASDDTIKNAVIEYTANTRGFYQKIVIKDQKIAVSNQRREATMPEAKAIADADWKLLIAAFSKIELEKIADLKSPTEKRFHDGAPAADMIIKYNEKEYICPTFDHGNPPAEVALLVNKMVDLAKQE